jgi:hypothetical protein
MSLTEHSIEHQLDPLSASLVSITDVLANLAFMLVVSWASSTFILEMTFSGW